MYLVLLRQATDFAHVMAHVGKIAAGVALMFVLIFVINRMAMRSGKSGKSKSRHRGSTKRHQRR